MPSELLSRIPLPSLKVYTRVSVFLVIACLYSSYLVISDPQWKLPTNSSLSNAPSPFDVETDAGGVGGASRGEHVTDSSPPINSDGGGSVAGIDNSNTVLNDLNIANTINDLAAAIANMERKNGLVDVMIADNEPKQMGDYNEQQHTAGGEEEASKSSPDESDANQDRSFMDMCRDIATFMSQEPMCIWTLINMAYCCLILLGKSIQKIVFGELRISEQQHMKDKFWNFVFYKFIFVFGVVNVQFLHEVILWVSWFSVLGFLHLLSQLCKDRFEYLSFSPTTPFGSHFRLVALLSAILTLSGIMFIICIGVGLFGGINTFAFMAAECVLLGIRTIHVLTRYAIFLYDMRINNEAISWDKRTNVTYYIELIFEVAALTIDLLHHLHMLFWSNIFLSMASLVIIMQLRYLAHEIQRKFKKHRNYLWVLNHMEKSYPLATQEDLSQNCDNCAICWEKMETARKLPCSHLFHNSCLQSWLEQDTSCPTCRLGLSVQNNVAALHHPNIERIEPEPTGRANNHFFHFNGSRYVSWLPNFSVEVTHINNLLRADPIPQTLATHTSQIRNMARQVQQMFPRYPISVIISDLQNTRSLELTVENILDGRLIVPARFQGDDEFDDAGPAGAGTVPASFAASSASDYYVIPSEFAHFSDSSNSSTPSSSPERESSPSASSFDSGYEIERNSNIFGNQNDLLRDDSQSDDIPLGDRFSKSSAEREKILQRRKEMLIAMARRRFIDKNKSELNKPSTSSATSSTSTMSTSQQQSEGVRHRKSTELGQD